MAMMAPQKVWEKWYYSIGYHNIVVVGYHNIVVVGYHNIVVVHCVPHMM